MNLYKWLLLTLTCLFLISCASVRYVTSKDLEQPLPVHHTSPRVSIAAPPATSVALELFRDNEHICTIVGRLTATVHRLYNSVKNNLVIADGVCYGKPIYASGYHRYTLRGYFFTPKGKKKPVDNTSSISRYNVIEPLILIDENAKISLTIGES